MSLINSLFPYLNDANKIPSVFKLFDSAEVEVNLADLTSAQRAKLLGQTVATEGGVYASDKDQAPYTAVLYKANLTGG